MFGDEVEPSRRVFRGPRMAFLVLGRSLLSDPGGAEAGDRVFDVGMGRVIGTSGETRLRIVVIAGTSDIITAHLLH